MESITNRKALGMVIFSLMAAFFAFPGITVAEYVPKSGENVQYMFSSSGQTVNVGSGYIYIPVQWDCDDTNINTYGTLSDIYGTKIYFHVPGLPSDRETIYGGDNFVFKGTITFRSGTTVECFFSGKKILETSWNAYANTSNSGAVVTTNFSGSTVNVSTGTGRTAEEWFTEVSNSNNAPAFLLWLALTVLTYIILPVGAFVIGWKYGAHFFTSSKNG